ncbi:MAG: hypothetical protein HZA50_12490 [Planctomycetes bacterium]|nr:hypothetical protein [Planctomycetota bacterium]
MNELDKFGEFFVQNFRDKALSRLQFIIERKWKSPSLQSLQNRLARLSSEDKQLIQELTDDIIIAAMHDVLFAFQESHDTGKGADITFNGKSMASMSDGLHGELFSEDGWIKKFSKHPYKEKI